MSGFQDVIIVGGLMLIVLVTFGALFFFLRDFRLRSLGPSHTQTDLTNMMIMFQTMRDVLAQQKDLAREFNLSIDKKVREVRDLIRSTGDVRNDLERAKREIAVLAAQTRRELAALEERLMQVDGKVRKAGGEGVGQAIELDEAVEAETDAADSSDSPEDAVEESEAPDGSGGAGGSDIVPDPVATPKDDFIDHWAGADFGSAEDSDYPESDEEPELSPVEEAEDATQTREAFRDLLNLHFEGRSHSGGPTSSEVLNSGSNGGQYLSPIQQRVYEYSDAGMRVPEIARELGVGKGEVRLMLSLRGGRGRQASG